jgi:hypothetical protein
VNPALKAGLKTGLLLYAYAGIPVSIVATVAAAPGALVGDGSATLTLAEKAVFSFVAWPYVVYGWMKTASGQGDLSPVNGTSSDPTGSADDQINGAKESFFSKLFGWL